jgi:hypothetical protein
VGKVDAGGAAVDRFNRETVFGQEQRVSADPATEIECLPRTAGLQFGQQRDHRGVRFELVGPALVGRPSRVPRFDRSRG